jgi:hypothetical protein
METQTKRGQSLNAASPFTRYLASSRPVFGSDRPCRPLPLNSPRLGGGAGVAVAVFSPVPDRAQCSLNDATSTPSRKSRKPPQSQSPLRGGERADGLAIDGLASSVKGFPAFLKRRR